MATRWHAPVLRYCQDNKASYGHQVACPSPPLLPCLLQYACNMPGYAGELKCQSPYWSGESWKWQQNMIILYD